MANKKSLNPITNFKQEMYNETGNYQKIYGYETNPDPNHASWNNEADAFKHAFMQAIGVQRYNVPIAAIFAKGHELKGKFAQGQPKAEENMDNWNNRVGRAIGLELREMLKNDPGVKNDRYVKNLAAELVMQKMREGKLITTPNDPRKFVAHPLINDTLNRLKDFSDTIIPNNTIAPLNDGKTFFTAKAIDNMTNKEFLNVQDIIDTQIKNKFAPSEYEAKQGVASGAYIYVDEYTRDDGTKVKGYYRKR